MNKMLLTLFAFGLLLNSCKKDKEDSPTSMPPVALKGTYKPYEVAEIRYKNTFDRTQPLSAKIDAKDAKVAVIDDSTLGIVVRPDLFAEGANTMTFSDNGKDLSLNIFRVAGTVVTDVAKAFADHKSQMQQQVDFIEGLKAGDTTGLFEQPEIKQMMDASKQAILDAEAAWNLLTQDEKLLFANILAANAPEFNQINTNLQGIAGSLLSNRPDLSKTTTQEWCTQLEYPKKWPRVWCFTKAFGNETTKLIKHTGLVIGSALTSLIGVTSYQHFHTCLANMSTSATNVGLIGYQFLHWRISVASASFFGKAGQKTTADATFSNNVAQMVPVTLTAQRIQASDAASSSAMVREMVGAILAYNSFCDKYPTYLSKFKLSFSTPSPASIGLSDLSEIIVSNVTNANVQFAGISGTPSSPQIKFANQSATDQNFNFDITYNDGVNQVRKATISGIVTAGFDRVQALTTGTWRITSIFEEWVENGQPKSGEYLDACSADNVYTFAPGGGGSWSTGAKKCNPDEVYTLQWSFASNNTVFHFGDGDVSLICNVISMTNSVFKIQRVYDDGGGLMVTQTITFSR